MHIYEFGFVKKCAFIFVMPKSWIIPLIVAAAGAVFLAFKSAKDKLLSSLSIGISSISLDESTLVPIVFIKISFTNPTGLPFTVQSLKGSITVDGTMVSTVNKNDKVLIPGHSEIIYIVPAKITILGIVAKVIDFFKNRRAEVSFRFVGTVRLNNIDVPMDLTHKLVP